MFKAPASPPPGIPRPAVGGGSVLRRHRAKIFQAELLSSWDPIAGFQYLSVLSLYEDSIQRVRRADRDTIYAERVD
jgi:hypothetical protein